MSKSNYRDLKVWQKTRALSKQIYAVTSTFPRTEMFGLVQQMRSAVLSILCNIAEGHGRWSNAEYRRFLTMARGSTLELEAQIVIAEDLEFVPHEKASTLNEDTTEIARMLNGIIRYLNGR